MSKRKKILLVKTPRLHEVATALGHVQENSSHFVGDPSTLTAPPPTDTKTGGTNWAKLAETAVSILGNVGGAGKVSKRQFYDYRDSAYHMIVDIYGGNEWDKIPGKPFDIFQNKVIKDSLLKNYRPELDAFNKMLKEYFPDIYGKINNTSIQVDRVTNANKINPEFIEDILRDVSSDYIAKLQQRAAAGIPLTSAEQKILDAYGYLDSKLRGAARNSVANDVGNFFLNYWWVFGLVIGGVVLIKVMKK